jgi:hypothetical protein
MVAKGTTAGSERCHAALRVDRSRYPDRAQAYKMVRSVVAEQRKGLA